MIHRHTQKNYDPAPNMPFSRLSDRNMLPHSAHSCQLSGTCFEIISLVNSLICLYKLIWLQNKTEIMKSIHGGTSTVLFTLFYVWLWGWENTILMWPISSHSQESRPCEKRWRLVLLRAPLPHKAFTASVAFYSSMPVLSIRGSASTLLTSS